MAKPPCSDHVRASLNCCACNTTSKRPPRQKYEKRTKAPSSARTTSTPLKKNMHFGPDQNYQPAQPAHVDPQLKEILSQARLSKPAHHSSSFLSLGGMGGSVPAPPSPHARHTAVVSHFVTKYRPFQDP